MEGLGNLITGRVVTPYKLEIGLEFCQDLRTKRSFS